MFSKDALDFLAAQAVASSSPAITVKGSDLVLIPDGYKIQDLETFKDQRDRFRGSFKTHSIADFCRYVDAHIGTGLKQKAGGFINQDVMSAMVIFNLGDQANAGHCDDVAQLTLRKTAAFEAVLSIIGKKLTQQELAEFIEDWSANVLSYAGEASISNVMAINGIRKMTIKQVSQRDSTVGDLKSSTSSMDDIEARSLEVMPTEFKFATDPYEGLGMQYVTLRLSVLTGGEAPILKLRLVGQEAQLEEIAQGFKKVIESEIGGLVTMNLGAFMPS